RAAPLTVPPHLAAPSAMAAFALFIRTFTIPPALACGTMTIPPLRVRRLHKQKRRNRNHPNRNYSPHNQPSPGFDSLLLFSILNSPFSIPLDAPALRIVLVSCQSYRKNSFAEETFSRLPVSNG